MRFDDKVFIAQQIKLHRKRLAYTQEELAEKVGLSVQHISRIESACYIPSLKSFFMLAEVLQIDLKLFGYGLSKTNDPKRDQLIQKVAQATEAELIFYENLMSATSDSLAKVKKKLL